MKNLTVPLLLAVLLAVLPARAEEQLISLSFEDAPLEQAIELYREWTGRTIIKQADVSARITLKGRQLTQNEAKQAIETVLAMNGIALVPMGEKFLKVVPIANARQEGLEVLPFDPEKKYTQADQLISQVIPLRYVVFADVQPLIQHLVHGYGKIIEMARINSVLITDTSANIARIMELVSMVDQPAEKIEPRIYQLKYAEAATVSGKLKELVEAAKTKKTEQTVVAGPVRTLPGVIRAPKADVVEQVGALPEERTEMIVGEVKLVADDRTNILIIFSKAANFSFFDNIIKVLDVPVDPAVIVEVINLEFAKAKDISGILNEFVGAAKASEKTKAPGTGGKAEGSKTVDEVIQRAIDPTGKTISAEAKNAIGRLSADTKILSDERSNALLLMGRKPDIEALKLVIASLDIMLAQVLLEAVILDISLKDDASSGVSWLYSNLKGTTTNAWGAGWSQKSLVGDSVVGTNIINSAFGAVAQFPQINLQAVVQLTKTTDKAKLLSAPIILTTDNTEAKITSGRQIPIERTTYGNLSQSTTSAGVEYKDVDLSLTITPHINPQNFVVMEIDYSASEIIGEQTVSAKNPPAISKRTMTASIAVDDKSTIVLGGLVSTRKSENSSKVPILGDIPLLGRLFQSRGKTDSRSEIVVLITPYVLKTTAEADRETKRIYNATGGKETLWPRGWSQSPLRNDEPEPEKDVNKKKKTDKKKAKAAEEILPVEGTAVQ